MVVHEPLERIKDGDLIQLVHGITSRTLNSHDVAAPVSPHHQEVSCYIDYNISMASQNLWRVQLLNPEETGGVWHTIRSLINLIHVNSSQALKFSGKQLPDWGFNQHEVVTDRSISHEDAIWNVEEHRYTRESDAKDRERDLVSAEFVPLTPTKLNFWQKMKELQYKMIISGSNDKIEGHMYENDSPLAWLFLHQGIAYWISPESNSQIFLVGNIILWIMSLFSLMLYSLAFLLILIAKRRKDLSSIIMIPSDAMWDKMSLVFRTCIMGYLLNFVPYFFVEKSLFLHDYLPCIIFKQLILAASLEFSESYLFRYTNTISSRIKRSTGIISITIIIMILCIVLSCSYCFLNLLPLSYGSGYMTSDQMLKLKWRESWHLILLHHRT